MTSLWYEYPCVRPPHSLSPQLQIGDPSPPVHPLLSSASVLALFGFPVLSAVELGVTTSSCQWPDDRRSKI